MKTRLQKTALLFGIVLGMNLIVCAQSVGRNTCDLIHYSEVDDKACQECWENHSKRQEILRETQRISQINDSLYNNERHQKGLISDTLTALKVDYAKAQNKVKRNRNIAWGTGVGFGVVAIIEGIWIWFKSKF